MKKKINKKTSKKLKRKLRKEVIYIGILILLIITNIFVWSFFKNNGKVVATVTIDINPSLKIELNKKEKVIAIEGLNEEGKDLVNDNSFENKSLEKSINIISDYIVKNDYISNDNNIILINVDDEDLKEVIKDYFVSFLEDKDIDCQIIFQKNNDNVKYYSEKYNISLTKASYIDEILSSRHDYKFEDLVNLSITDIYRISLTEEQKEEEKTEDKKEEEVKTPSKNPSSGSTTVNYNYQKDKAELDKLIAQYSGNAEEITNMIRNLQVVALGDSVMLGAESNLKSLFPKIYFDAKVSRGGSAIKSIMESLKKSGTLGEPIVISTGTNGDCSEQIKKEIMQIAGDREVFWLTVTNDSKVNVNTKLKNFAANYSNLHIIDWEATAVDLCPDGVHISCGGNARKTYAQVIYNAIYKVYVAKFNSMIEEAKEKEEETTKKENTTETKKEELPQTTPPEEKPQIEEENQDEVDNNEE